MVSVATIERTGVTYTRIAGDRPEGEMCYVPLRGVGELLGLVGDLERWRERAACQTADYALFDPPTTGEASGRHGQPARVLSAVRICAECPVTMECYRAAYQLRMQGVWGGVFRRGDSSNSQAYTSEIVIDPESGEVVTARRVRNPRRVTENVAGVGHPLTQARPA